MGSGTGPSRSSMPLACARAMSTPPAVMMPGGGLALLGRRGAVSPAETAGLCAGLVSPRSSSPLMVPDPRRVATHGRSYSLSPVTARTLALRIGLLFSIRITSAVVASSERVAQRDGLVAPRADRDDIDGHLDLLLEE